MGLLCLLIFVNYLGNDITSNIKLFADDILLYDLLHNSDDATSLESDLHKLVEWAKLWQMHGLQPIEVTRSTRLQNQVSFYTPIYYAWPYPTGCRPLSLPRSFPVRGPKLEATYPEHYKHVTLPRGTCIIAHRGLKIKPTNG